MPRNFEVVACFTTSPCICKLQDSCPLLLLRLKRIRTVFLEHSPILQPAQYRDKSLIDDWRRLRMVLMWGAAVYNLMSSAYWDLKTGLCINGRSQVKMMNKVGLSGLPCGTP